MADLESIVFSCSRRQFSTTLSATFRALPAAAQKRFRAIVKDYFAAYGVDGTYERLNDRTAAQIFAEYQPTDVKPIASGEESGVRYDLYEANPRKPADGDESTAEG
jgi:hypothetical protein